MTRAVARSIIAFAFVVAVVAAAFCASFACLAGVGDHCFEETGAVAQATLTLGGVVAAAAVVALPVLFSRRTADAAPQSSLLPTTGLALAPLRI